MTKKENSTEKYIRDWENHIKGRSINYREDQIISLDEWSSLNPKEKINFTHLNDEEKIEFVNKLRINPDPVATADESQGTKSGNTASPSQKEAEKEKNKNV